MNALNDKTTLVVSYTDTTVYYPLLDETLSEGEEFCPVSVDVNLTGIEEFNPFEDLEHQAVTESTGTRRYKLPATIRAALGL